MACQKSMLVSLEEVGFQARALRISKIINGLCYLKQEYKPLFFSIKKY
jgi:hypothetical protein